MQNRYCDSRRCKCQPLQFPNKSDADTDVTQAGGVGSTGQAVGSLVLVDAVIANTPTGIITTLFKENSTSLLLQNVGFFNTKTAVYEEAAKKDLLAGGNEVKVESWGFGMLNTPDGSTFVNGQNIPAVKRPEILLSPDMAYAGPNLYTRRRPKYLDIGSTQVLNVKALGAKGDGKTDDTNTLNGILDGHRLWEQEQTLRMLRSPGL